MPRAVDELGRVPLFAELQRNTEPVALSSTVSTNLTSWVSRPSAFGLWRRHQLTCAPCSVRTAIYASEHQQTRSQAKKNGATSARLFAKFNIRLQTTREDERQISKLWVSRQPMGHTRCAVPVQCLLSTSMIPYRLFM